MRQNQHTFFMIQRWIALVAILANVTFNYIYSYITPSPSIREVTDNYPTYFTPAPFTFIIWALIYLAFIVYGIIQLAPSQRDHSIYDRLSGLITMVNLLGALWIVFYTDNYIGASLICISVMLLCTAILFSRAHKAVVRRNYNLWLQVPFCMMAAWLTVALPANAFVYLKYLGWIPGVGEGDSSIVMILVAALTGLIVSIRTSSLVYPAVIAWGLYGISAARENDLPSLSYIALTCALLLIITSVTTAVFRKIKVSKKIKSGLDAG